MSVYMALIILSRSSPGYELSFGNSLAKFGQLGAENNCVTCSQTLCRFIYRCGV